MKPIAENQLQQRVVEAQPQGERLLAALREKIAMLDLPGEDITIPPFESFRFKLEDDPYSGAHTLRAAFFPKQSYCIGFLLFHSDGSSFAEYHVMRPHPIRSQWFIEAVEAWGRDEAIKTDVRMAVMPQ
jgi:hypothetical protein